MKSPRWQRQNINLWQRQLEIFAVASQFVARLGKDKFFGGKNESSNRRRQARWLVNHLLDLGPTFIKIGQAMSTRPDLFPIEYIEELSQLQDRVPPFNSTEAIAVIEKSFEKSLYSVFKDFDQEPLASASLGQVHKAILYTGEEVAVKVQRPGLKNLFHVDIQVIERLMAIAGRFAKDLHKYNLTQVCREFFDLLYQEIDYVQEGKNGDHFRSNFAGQNHILVPKVYWQYTTERVLTLEYLPGIKIDDRAALEAVNINPDNVISLGISAYLKQLLQDGFFQSDPHPGNMAVDEDGKLIFYDFGTMTEVKSMEKTQMMRTFFAILRKDTDEVVDTLVYMGLVEPMADMTPIKRMIAFLLDKFRDRPVDLKEFEQISGEIYLMFEQQPFRLPPQMTFIIKAITTLDGIARALDPQYNLLAAAQPFVRSIAISKEENESRITSLAKQAKEFVLYQIKKPTRTEMAIKRLESRIELGEIQFRVKSLESDRQLRRIYLAVKTIMYGTLSGFATIVGVLLLSYPNYAIAVFCIALFLGFLTGRSLLKLLLQERIDRLVRK
ncbi:ABC-1 domain-containing protein [[Leptolyngbya] sp. PCC 7376]|uniref:ABC1 kinase family protein n=1 Tax=[Leptolyngbya] sp. PCC 7376 TaxID=111781 RepID=UPI00029EEDDC|nr:AarF/ABC1/UbiB kinase family protein [[Leptolyngbya] sp. PCC 7376]AFY37004.1 ABC-1 domain-containing protein [[Leptolyngbya] sp. PCC 7376]